MNKKLDRLIGQKAAEKVGKGWAPTSFNSILQRLNACMLPTNLPRRFRPVSIVKEQQHILDIIFR
jgi:hypothetical protein